MDDLLCSICEQPIGIMRGFVSVQFGLTINNDLEVVNLGAVKPVFYHTNCYTEYMQKIPDPKPKQAPNCYGYPPPEDIICHACEWKKDCL